MTESVGGPKKDKGVNLDVAAKAELKASVHTEIPRETTGRVVEALLDVIRPFTEERGLKADLVRLQREDVALKIARRARQKLLLQKEELNPIPIKALVPLLERCSLEEDEVLFEMWADLLASASVEYDSAVLSHTHALSMMGKQGAELVNRMVQEVRENATYRIKEIPRSNKRTQLYDTLHLRITSLQRKISSRIIHGNPELDPEVERKLITDEFLVLIDEFSKNNPVIFNYFSSHSIEEEFEFGPPFQYGRMDIDLESVSKVMIGVPVVGRGA